MLTFCRKRVMKKKKERKIIGTVVIIKKYIQFLKNKTSRTQNTPLESVVTVEQRRLILVEGHDASCFRLLCSDTPDLKQWVIDRHLQNVRRQSNPWIRRVQTSEAQRAVASRTRTEHRCCRGSFIPISAFLNKLNSLKDAVNISVTNLRTKQKTQATWST